MFLHFFGNIQIIYHMKKSSIIFSVLLLMASLVSVFYCVKKSDIQLCEDDVEALSYCEINDGKGAVVLLCKGENTCSEKKLGYTLTCDGTRVE